ncbi:MAG: Spermidine N(1)-acetyltransferase [Candidatus Celerinatantimonas neptuna]|nr:MAG: Spermidine N(1)-acetyltransferase [Candidatus Celerinatantimonas neptuna]
MRLQSTQVNLRPLQIEDAPSFFRWAEDPKVIEYSSSGFIWPRSHQDIRQWLTDLNQQRHSISLGICCNNTGKLIGYSGIVNMSMLNRCGEFFILIGERNYWNKGIATEVVKLVTAYGFQSLNLHRIELSAYVLNPAAIRTYEKAGFQHEGILREAGFRHGKYIDKVIMSAIEHEWL